MAAYLSNACIRLHIALNDVNISNFNMDTYQQAAQKSK